MDKLLEKISKENDVVIEDVEKILDIEKKSVYKKKRFIFGDLRQIIIERISSQEESHDNK